MAECQVSQNFSISCLLLRIHLSIKPVPSDRRSGLREQEVGKVAACQNHDLLTSGHTWCTYTGTGVWLCMDRCIEEESQELRGISLCTAIRMCNWAASIYTEVYFSVTTLYSNQKKYLIRVCHPELPSQTLVNTWIHLKMWCSTSSPALTNGFLPIPDSIRGPNSWFFFFRQSCSTTVSYTEVKVRFKHRVLRSNAFCHKCPQHIPPWAVTDAILDAYHQKIISPVWRLGQRLNTPCAEMGVSEK